jgi:hypothetical protein
VLPPTPFAPSRSHQPCGGFGGHHPHQLTEIIKPIDNPSSGSVQRHLQKLIEHGHVGARRQRVSRLGQGEYPRPAEQAAEGDRLVTETAKRLAELSATP